MIREFRSYINGFQYWPAKFFYLYLYLVCLFTWGYVFINMTEQ